MLRWRRTRFVWLLLVVCSQSPNLTQAQSALEKLEKKVREQLGEQTPDKQSGELPAPRPPSGPSSSDASPDTKVPAPVANPEDAPEPRLPAASPTESTGQIYLGLEAEEPLGGGIGVRVTAVTPQSPAWKAGFQVGDRILAVKDFAIANLDGMVQQLSKASPGESVRFLVLRNGRNINLTTVLMDARLAARLNGASSVGPASDSVHGGEPGWLGIVVRDLSPSFRQQFAIPVFTGAAVTNVAAGSPAQKMSIRAGDVVTEANGKPIGGERDLLAWMSGRRAGEQVELRVYRGSAVRSVQVTLEVNPADRKTEPRNRTPENRPLLSAGPAAPGPAIPDVGTEPSIENGNFPSLRPSTPGSPVAEPSNEPEQAGTPASEIQQLKQENQRLKSELIQARQRLEETQQQLNRILETLKGDSIDLKPEDASN